MDPACRFLQRVCAERGLNGNGRDPPPVHLMAWERRAFKRSLTHWMNMERGAGDVTGQRGHDTPSADRLRTARASLGRLRTAGAPFGWVPPGRRMCAIWAPPGYRMGIAWAAPPGHRLGTAPASLAHCAWAPPERRLGTAWAPRGHRLVPGRLLGIVWAPPGHPPEHASLGHLLGTAWALSEHRLRTAVWAPRGRRLGTRATQRRPAPGDVLSHERRTRRAKLLQGSFSDFVIPCAPWLTCACTRLQCESSARRDRETSSRSNEGQNTKTCSLAHKLQDEGARVSSRSTPPCRRSCWPSLVAALLHRSQCRPPTSSARGGRGAGRCRRRGGPLGWGGDSRRTGAFGLPRCRSASPPRAASSTRSATSLSGHCRMGISYGRAPATHLTRGLPSALPAASPCHSWGSHSGGCSGAVQPLPSDDPADPHVLSVLHRELLGVSRCGTLPASGAHNALGRPGSQPPVGGCHLVRSGVSL